MLLNFPPLPRTEISNCDWLLGKYYDNKLGKRRVNKLIPFTPLILILLSKLICVKLRFMTLPVIQYGQLYDASSKPRLEERARLDLRPRRAQLERGLVQRDQDRQRHGHSRQGVGAVGH